MDAMPWPMMSEDFIASIVTSMTMLGISIPKVKLHPPIICARAPVKMRVENSSTLTKKHQSRYEFSAQHSGGSVQLSL